MMHYFHYQNISGLLQRLRSSVIVTEIHTCRSTTWTLVMVISILFTNIIYLFISLMNNAYTILKTLKYFRSNQHHRKSAMSVHLKKKQFKTFIFQFYSLPLLYLYIPLMKTIFCLLAHCSIIMAYYKHYLFTNSL